MEAIRTLHAYAISIFIAIFLPITGMAQCTGPSCVILSSPPLVSVIPQEVKTLIENASCIVIDGNSRGSGTIVRVNNSVLVFTAGHVISSKRAIIRHREKAIECVVHHDDNQLDFAILEPISDQESLYQDYAVTPYTGETPSLKTVFISGFDGLSYSRTIPASFIGFTRHSLSAQYADWMVVSVSSRPGDSGGGIFLTDARLIGIIWGTDRTRTIGTWIGPVLKTSYSITCIWSWRRPPSPQAPPSLSPNPPAQAPAPSSPSQPPAPPSDPPSSPAPSIGSSHLLLILAGSIFALGMTTLAHFIFSLAITAWQVIRFHSNKDTA